MSCLPKCCSRAQSRDAGANDDYLERHNSNKCCLDYPIKCVQIVSEEYVDGVLSHFIYTSASIPYVSDMLFESC